MLVDTYAWESGSLHTVLLMYFFLPPSLPPLLPPFLPPPSLPPSFLHFLAPPFLLPSEHDQLLCLVYERVQVAEGSIDPHLWAYRFRITLEHLSQTLQHQNMQKKCSILYAFLQEVC